MRPCTHCPRNMFARVAPFSSERSFVYTSSGVYVKHVCRRALCRCFVSLRQAASLREELEGGERDLRQAREKQLALRKEVARLGRDLAKVTCRRKRVLMGMLMLVLQCSSLTRALWFVRSLFAMTRLGLRCSLAVYTRISCESVIGSIHHPFPPDVTHVCARNRRSKASNCICICVRGYASDQSPT